MRIEIKPLSINKAYRSGPRYKTKDYLAYIDEANLKLKPLDIPDGELSLYIDAGLSNKGGDIDNIAKPFIDILQKKYGFNDNRIYQLTLIKTIVKKGDEYIDFHIEAFDLLL